MSHSKKDGKRGGAHRGGKRGKEYWSRRPPNDMATPSKSAKTHTHRLERRAAKKLARED